MTKNIFWIALGTVLAYLCWWLLPFYLPGKKAAHGSPEFIAQESAKLNQGLPALLDKETELTITEPAHGMLIYKYRLINVTAAQVDHEKFRLGSKPQLVQLACSRPETREEYLSKAVSLRYSYFDKDKQHVATIDVTPADCGM